MPPEQPIQPTLPAQPTSPSNRLKVLLLILGILIIAGGVYAYFSYFSTKPGVESKSIVTFEQCAKAGNPIMESFPEQCRTKDGVHFINWRSTEQTCIQVVTPATNPSTGETRDFPTPCDVPSNWDVVESPESPTNTSGLQTYRNEEYGFEFEYPRNEVVPDTPVVVVGPLAKMIVLEIGMANGISIYPQGEFDYGIEGVPVISDVYIGGKKAKKNFWSDYNMIHYHIVEPIPNWVTCDENLKNCNRIRLSWESPDQLELLNKILSTFKFTSSTPPNTTLPPVPDQPTACTMDAMMCPDGSYVGRTGPKCEFVCP